MFSDEGEEIFFVTEEGTVRRVADFPGATHLSLFEGTGTRPALAFAAGMGCAKGQVVPLFRHVAPKRHTGVGGW